MGVRTPLACLPMQANRAGDDQACGPNDLFRDPQSIAVRG
ncbi:hypothetical protein BH23CHL8_BH23CHL8_17830 [soil metagenome]